MSDLGSLDLSELLAYADRCIAGQMWKQAGAALREAAKAWPNDGDVALCQAQLELRRWALIGDTEGRPLGDPAVLALAERGRQLLRRATVLDPGLRVQCLLTEAIVEFRYDRDRALELCQEAIQAERTPLTLGQYASLLAEAGRYSDAAPLFEEALALDQDHFLNLINYGRCCVRANHPDPSFAAFIFSRAVEVRPDSAEAHYRLGDALGVLPGELEVAKGHLEVALALGPTPRLRKKIESALQETKAALSKTVPPL